MKKTTIYTNGQILTVDENDSIAASMAVCGDKIIATGDFEQVRALCPDDAEIVDHAMRLAAFRVLRPDAHLVFARSELPEVELGIAAF